MGFDPVSETVTTNSRAPYYPGWSRVVETTADAGSGRLLGPGLAGEEGAAHRVDAAATAIHAGMTVDEVGLLDYGSSPSFGPSWDAGLVGAKVLAGEPVGGRVRASSAAVQFEGACRGAEFERASQRGSSSGTVLY